jgi:hypothetical protein
MATFGYIECNEKKGGNLKTAQLILADKVGGNKVKLGRAGPEPNESAICKGFNFPSALIESASIYADSERVFGIEF